MRNNSFYCVKIPLELRKKFANFRLALEPENTTFGSAGADFGADFSNDRKYRYSLWRIWDRTKPLVMFIGLNPSTANETENDATIRSVGRIAKANGYGGFYMMNCWAYISTDPEKLRDHRFNELICEWNDNMLTTIKAKCKDVVFAWGSFSIVKETGRDKELSEMFPNAKALFINKNGSPKHPLYCKADTKFVEWSMAAGCKISSKRK